MRWRKEPQTNVDVAQNAVVLSFGDLGPLEGAFSERVADDASGFDLRLEGFNEFLVDGFLDKNSGCRSADLEDVRVHLEYKYWPLPGLVDS